MLAGLAAAHAANVRSLQVNEQSGQYRIHMLAHLDVAAPAAFAVLTNYSRLARINPAIRRVHASSASDGVRLETWIHVCVLFYCRTLHQVQMMTTTGERRVQARVLPAQGDFRSGSAEWRISADGRDDCLLDFHARLRPDFWVPPLIGPWLIKRQLQSQAITTARGMERAARADQ